MCLEGVAGHRLLSVIFLITSERDGIGTIIPISPGVSGGWKRTLGQSQDHGLSSDIPSVPVIPTKGAVEWGKHCHFFSYKAIGERLTGKRCLCTHALF